jgi:hypothetical protein
LAGKSERITAGPKQNRKAIIQFVLKIRFGIRCELIFIIKAGNDLKMLGKRQKILTIVSLKNWVAKNECDDVTSVFYDIKLCSVIGQVS